MTGKKVGLEGWRVWVREVRYERSGVLIAVPSSRLATVRIFESREEAKAWAANFADPIEIHPAEHVPADAEVASAHAVRQAVNE